MSKKLDSRQDVLDVWVSKWAKIDWNVVKTFTEEWMWNQNTTYLINKEYEWTWNSRPEYHSIREILYSPESNFFSTMFPIKNPLLVDSQSLYSDKERSSYSAKAKAICVMSPDPLVRLLNAHNETPAVSEPTNKGDQDEEGRARESMSTDDSPPF